MARCLVVYESIFGNTRDVALAIAEGLSTASDLEVEALEVGKTSDDSVSNIDFVVAGGPTHMWGMSRGFSRSGARQECKEKNIEPVSRGKGIRDWLKQLQDQDPLRKLKFASFDTRVEQTGWFPTGGASPKIAAELEKCGAKKIAEARCFYVSDSEGPMKDGELERARSWGQELALSLKVDNEDAERSRV